MKQHGFYYYKVIEEQGDDSTWWVYEIYATNRNNQIPLRESSEYYDTKFQAEMAAIGHITLIEKGEG